MSGFDDVNQIDDLLGDLDAELEARFQQLEQRADLDEVRAKMARDSNGRAAPQTPPAATEDPLHDLKAAFEQPEPAATREYLWVVCPSCRRKNRLDRLKALEARPRCGACGAALVFRA